MQAQRIFFPSLRGLCFAFVADESCTCQVCDRYPGLGPYVMPSNQAKPLVFATPCDQTRQPRTRINKLQEISPINRSNNVMGYSYCNIRSSLKRLKANEVGVHDGVSHTVARGLFLPLISAHFHHAQSRVHVGMRFITVAVR